MIERRQSPLSQADDTRTALDLLAAGVPLTLLIDLATLVNSHDVYEQEPGVADWLHVGAA